MKVLFILPYPTEGPSNRYRVEQYIPFLREQGIYCCLRPFITSEFYRILYAKGNTLKKCVFFLISFLKRTTDVIRAIKYDIIFIHIEAFPFGPPLFELIFRAMGKPIIFDFEDAIYLPVSQKGFYGCLKFPKKFYLNIRLSSHIIVCNNYLKERLCIYNPDITVIPTAIDEEKFNLKTDKVKFDRLIIGWVGSHTTLPCFKQLIPALEKLSEKHEFILKIVGGGTEVKIPGIKIINEKWSLKKEVENFTSLDIGVYPLPDNEWAKAKTPFKTIQYMSVGVPTVASSVGGNREIIQDGINGFLASNKEEWVEKLSLLITNPLLRKKLGAAGRDTVEDRYSLKVNAPKLLEVLRKTYGVRYGNNY